MTAFKMVGRLTCSRSFLMRMANVFLFCYIGFLSSCATTPTAKVGNLRSNQDFQSQRVEPEARNIFLRAERNFAQKRFDEATAGFQEIKSRYPNAYRANMLASYRLGMIFYQNEQYDEASREFTSFLSRFKKSDLTFDVRYNLAASLYQLKQYRESYQTLSKFSLKEIRDQGPNRAELVFQLTEYCAEALNNDLAAIMAYAAHAQLPISNAAKKNIYDKSQFRINQINDNKQLDRLLARTKEPVIRKQLMQRMGILAANFASPTGPQTGDMSPNGLPLSSSTAANRLHVGVILPLSGKNAKYGQRALQGILLAAETFKQDRDFDFRLFVENSRSNVAVARAAVDKLFNQHNVIAILGPLQWGEAIAVADRAQQLGVLNLSLTSKEGVSRRGAYLFQNALTAEVQLESLVQYCIEQKDFRRFAIMAPNDAYGRDMANRFWDLVDKNGGQVVGYEPYPTDEKDFQKYVKSLSGLADVRFRKDEWDKLNEFKTEYKERTKRSANVQLPPIVDFDAIFLPDRPATVASIAASFAYFDAAAPLLGTAEWNSSLLYRRGGRYVVGALFPGALSRSTQNPVQKEFLHRFIKAYGNTPDLLATQAYESMDLIRTVLKTTSSNSRNDVVLGLANLRNVETPLGKVSFDQTRIARRSLPVFRLEDGGRILEIR